jgi:hypothetical protein
MTRMPGGGRGDMHVIEVKVAKELRPHRKLGVEAQGAMH